MHSAGRFAPSRLPRPLALRTARWRKWDFTGFEASALSPQTDGCLRVHRRISSPGACVERRGRKPGKVCRSPVLLIGARQAVHFRLHLALPSKHHQTRDSTLGSSATPSRDDLADSLAEDPAEVVFTSTHRTGHHSEGLRAHCRGDAHPPRPDVSLATLRVPARTDHALTPLLV